jgi:5-oxoprolinase (ATP-hydrolysing) subunit A
VKPHGALYNRIAGDVACAEAVAEAVRSFGAELALVLRAGSAALPAARAVGVTVVAEGFCDRGYLPDGSLAPRTASGALVTDVAVVAARAVSLALEGRVASVDGSHVLVDCQTLCVHGDSPGAARLGRAVRDALVGSGVTVVAP